MGTMRPVDWSANTGQRTLPCMVLVVLFAASCVPLRQVPPRQEPVTVVGANGTLSPARSAAVVAQAVADAPDPATIERLESLMEGISDQPLYKDNDVRLLVDGPATYAAMLAAIHSASQYINLETYIFNDDRIGRKFADALADKAEQGVEVRLIYDSLGSRDSSPEFFERLSKAGVALVEFHPVNPVTGGNPLNLNVRDHRKILIVDGEVAFTGGINIDRNYANSSMSVHRTVKNGWRDTHIEIRGTAVQGLQRLFDTTWNAHGGDGSGVAERYFSRSSIPGGHHLVRVLSATGGDQSISPIRIAYQYAMEAARERIWITTSYFAPDPDFLRTMKDAASRGVDVSILVAGQDTDAPLLLYASRSFYGDLLKSGVRIYESRDIMLHAKTAVIDGVWSTVGSSNLDYRSFIHNDEVNAVIVGEDFAREMEDLFRQDLAQADAISLARWQDRPFTNRVKETLSRVLQYWL